jgi:hypothetical protein
MFDINELTTQQQVELWNKRKKEKREYLNQQYPNKSIQEISIEDLKKIGYAIGIGSTLTKKEFIDKIIEKQDYDNPIIQKRSNGELVLNDNVKLMSYIRG